MPTISYRNLVDEELIGLIAIKRDQNAIATLYTRYAHLIIGACLKYQNIEDAKNTLTQIFQKIWVEAERLETKRFKLWLFQEIKTICNDAEDVNELNKIRLNNINIPFTEQQRVIEMLKQYIGKLPKVEKYCIEQFYLEQKTYNDIAQIINCTPQDVQLFIQSGRKKINSFLTTSVKS